MTPDYECVFQKSCVIVELVFDRGFECVQLLQVHHQSKHGTDFTVCSGMKPSSPIVSNRTYFTVYSGMKLSSSPVQARELDCTPVQTPFRT